MVDLASVLQRHWPAYAALHGDRILPSHRAAVAAVLRCRTAALGGQLFSCGPCGRQVRVFHSCHHRACPRCGEPETSAWRDAQRARLLPVPYFLVTFTVPQELRAPFRAHQSQAYNILFREAAQALQDVAAQPRLLGAQLGFLGVLHTWTRQLIHHPHVHFLVPAGGLSTDARRWVRPHHPDYLLPDTRLAARFRSRLRAALRTVPDLASTTRGSFWRKPWIVNIRCVGSGENALNYLAAYVHRTALGSKAIQADDERGILLRYRDGDTGSLKTLRLAPQEFLRRWLQHVLPRGFKRVRHYGWLSPAANVRWERILRLLAWQPPLRPPPTPTPVPTCPCCQRPMVLLGTFPRAP
jgi:hypothetical protein